MFDTLRVNERFQQIVREALKSENADTSTEDTGRIRWPVSDKVSSD
jgi:hypothetical protein